MFRYTFKVKEWGTRKFLNISKVFNEELNNEKIHKELGSILDSGNYKDVILKRVDQVDEDGEVVRKIDFKKW